jgi:hypothetical protein
MTTQNYLMVNKSTNVVDNICIWNGDVDTWQPPEYFLMLAQATTPAMIWQEVVVDNKVINFILTEQTGAGEIGFTWDGTVLTTNEPKPTV